MNLLLLRQSYLTKKLQQGHLDRLAELKAVQLMITTWYDQECEKVKHQSRVQEITQDEKVRIYHHELHSKHIKKSSILKLNTEEGMLEGHDACQNCY